jgi:hypothetical protein
MTIPPFDPSSEDCRCVCHEKLGIIHVTPCCMRCPRCLRHIVTHAWENHLKRCGTMPGGSP